MLDKTLLVPERRRVLAPPFAWIDRRYLFDGFLARLGPQENLLYFFLVLAADRDGLSFYGYDKICTLLQLDADAYIQARNSLVQKHLIAFDGRRFQVLALPKQAPKPQSSPPAEAVSPAVSEPNASGQRRSGAAKDAQALGAIFAKLAQQHQAGQQDLA